MKEKIKQQTENCSKCLNLKTCQNEKLGHYLVAKDEKELNCEETTCDYMKQKLKHKKIEKLLQVPFIPESIRKFKFHNFNKKPGNIEAYNYIFNYDSNCKSAILAGSTGIGKTHLICALLNNQLNQNEDLTVLFLTSSQILDCIKNSFKTDTTFEILRCFVKVDILVIDDLGAEKTTEWVSDQLLKIIDTRNMYERPTFYTTNYPTPLELIKKLSRYADGQDEIAGQRIVSRILGAAEWLVIDDKDNRF